MSKIEEALAMCLELGRIIARTDEYKAMKKAEYNLLHDAEARKMVENLQQLQVDQAKKQMSGIELTEAEKKNLRETEQTAIQHPVVRDSHMANANFQEIMKEISKKIREGINAHSAQ